MSKKTMELEYGNHRIDYATTQPLLLNLDDQPFTVVSPGTGKIMLRKTAGKLSVDAVGKEKFKLDVSSHITQPGEAVDDREVPMPPPPNSYLAKLRARVQASMGNTREAFAERMSIYEVVDNLDDFEEEREARQNDMSEKSQGDANVEPQASESNEQSGEASE